MFDRLDQEDRILHREWDKYDGQHVVFQPSRMSIAELEQGHEALWREVYSLKGMCRRIAVRLTNQLSFFPVILGANVGYRFYARNLHRFYTCTGGTV